MGPGKCTENRIGAHYGSDGLILLRSWLLEETMTKKTVTPGRSETRLSAVILDMDGLMFDTERIALETWQEAGRACSCEIPEQLIVQTIGLGLQDTRALFEQTLGPSLDFDRLRALRIQYAAEIIDERGVPLKEGLRDLLDLLDRIGLKRAVATSTEHARALELLSRADLQIDFDAVVCGDEVTHAKPAPDIFLLAAARMRVVPDECLVLEDSEAGIRSAVSAGMRAVVIPDLLPPSREVARLADRVLSTLTDAATHIEAMLPAG